MGDVSTPGFQLLVQDEDNLATPTTPAWVGTILILWRLDDTVNHLRREIDWKSPRPPNCVQVHTAFAESWDPLIEKRLITEFVCAYSLVLVSLSIFQYKWFMVLSNLHSSGRPASPEPHLTRTCGIDSIATLPRFNDNVVTMCRASVSKVPSKPVTW